MQKLSPNLQLNEEKLNDDAKATRRTQAAADILAKVTDGILAKGEKRLTFNRNPNAAMYGGGGFMGGMQVVENDYQKISGAFEMMTQHFYNVARRTEDDTTRNLLLKKLEAIKASLDEETKSQGKSSFTQRTLNDLNYLIAYYKGSPPAKLPKDSLIWDGRQRQVGLGGGVF